MAERDVPPDKIEETLIRRVKRRISQLNPASPELRRAMIQIGFTYQREMVSALRRSIYNTPPSPNYVRTGRLLNSIRYTIRRVNRGHEITVGSFNVPYAAIHEFGFKGVVAVRAHKRLQTYAFGNKLEPPVNVNISAHDRSVNVKARPYIIPGAKNAQSDVIQILRDLVRGKNA